jgi:hypothetical protein
LRSIGVREGPEHENTMSGQCNKPKFMRSKLGYNNNLPIKPNVIIFVATVHVEQHLKREEEAYILPIFKNHLRNLPKL